LVKCEKTKKNPSSFKKPRKSPRTSGKNPRTPKIGSKNPRSWEKTQGVATLSVTSYDKKNVTNSGGSRIWQWGGCYFREKSDICETCPKPNT